MRIWLIRTIYTYIFYLSLPFIIIYQVFKYYKSGYSYCSRLLERFGLVPIIRPLGCILIHAVSFGEVCATLPLIKILREQYPKIPIMVTTSTITGSQQVLSKFGNNINHTYMPYDIPNFVKRLLKRTRPRLVIIMETELWPNLINACALCNIPVLVANARLSEHSARNYYAIKFITNNILSNINIIAAQSVADANRFKQLGASCVYVTGNIKYDVELPKNLKERAEIIKQQNFKNREILIAASTHAGEEEILLSAFKILRKLWPNLLLLIVPRHPNRCNKVASLCEKNGFNLIRRSTYQPCNAKTTVFLLDTMGELLLFYATADLAFVGGSLVPVGGHNVLEPAVIGLPVLFGPHMFNFVESSQLLLSASAAFMVVDTKSIVDTVTQLLAAPELRKQVGQYGQKVVLSNRGAILRLLLCIKSLNIS